MVCEQCKAQLEDNANYCTNCGQSIISITQNRKNNLFFQASKISFGIMVIAVIASSIYQTIFFNTIGVPVPIELYGEIFGRFFGYGLLAIPLIYLFLKIKKA